MSNYIESSNYTDPANMSPAWSNEHCEAAQREGWDIFDTHGSDGGPWQIQRFDDASEVPGAPQLKDDESAWRIVIQGTAAHHEAARQFIRTHSPQEWASINQREVPNYKAHAEVPAQGAPSKLHLALEKLVPHVLHYASMPHAHADAHRDVADARRVLADLAKDTREAQGNVGASATMTVDG